MTEFYTVIGFVGEKPSSDTDVSTNSHRSVRSYKTAAVARRAVQTGVKEPGVDYWILRTTIDADLNIRSEWVEEVDW
ncbi:hypothetical protein FDH96_gp134 [Mycobacterium phage Rey]|uniref:Uncharacterized protein n=1 Tax=Mycobacterium phage Rey TaxID=1034115 RepID=G1D5I5_9CAUD|nr:hypothetical protein FDH96_gp134 [Mycobacterium phage Rey]AEK10033.1 hypothetical protein PBI_REY_145 [Mycobacterium phage Rey]